MKTEYLVDELILLHNGWNRDGDHGVLRYLNMANQILVSVDAEQNIVFEDGELPVIDTNEGERSYSVAGRRVIAVVVKAEEVAVTSDYGRARTSPQNAMVIGGISYVRVPYIRTADRINSNLPAVVTFTKDPGVATDYYRVVMYKTPTDILSESVEHDIIEPYDIEILLPAASALITGFQNFTLPDSINYVRSVLVPQYSKVLGDGDQGYMDSEPVSRGF